ncbi:MAG: ABC transporter substrate-binding protein [Geodermatophilaceae bacterium]
MGHRLRPVLVPLVLSMLLTACAADNGGEPGGADSDGAGSGDGPILIGVNVEQSGGASVQGQAYVNAVTLLVEQINADGGILGRDVELEIVDNATDQTEAVTLTNQLVQQGVVAMIGPGTSPTTLAAMDVILDSGIPTISMGSSDVISDPASEHPNVFKTPQRGSLQAEELVAHFEEVGIESVGLIAVNNAYGDNGVESMQALADEGAIELVGVERFEAEDTSMVAQLNNLLGAGAEAILCWAIPPGAPTVRRNAVENLGIDVPMYFDAGAGAELFIELAGEAANDAFIVHPKTLIWDDVATDDPQTEALQAFGEAYTAEYGQMSGFAGYAWDALGLLRAAIEDSGDTTPEAIISGLEGLGEYVGVTGTFEITAEDHQGLGEGDMVILQVEDGDWIPVSAGG